MAELNNLDKSSKPKKEKKLPIKFQPDMNLIAKVVAELMSKNNPYHGQSYSKIIKDGNSKKAEQLFKTEYMEQGGKQKNLRNNVYKIAVIKMWATAKADPLLAKDMAYINPTQFAEILACDDLNSLISSIPYVGTAYKGAKYLYDNHPQVKSLVDKVVNAGYNKIHSILDTNTKLIPTEKTTPTTGTNTALMGTVTTFSKQPSYNFNHSHYQSVNLRYIFTNFLQNLDPAGDPNDIPQVVFAGKTTMNITFTASTAGSGIITFFPFLAYAGSATNSVNSFYAINNSPTYDPTAITSTGSFVYYNGPLGAQTNAGTIAEFKATGLTIDITPFSSLNNSQGGYMVVPIQQQISQGPTSVIPIGSVYNTAMLSQLPSATIYDFKTLSRVNMVPSADPDDVDWIKASTTSPAPTDYGKVIIQILGATSGATLNLKVTVTWSVIPSSSLAGFVKGAMPEMGAATDKFCEFLKARFPDIVCWREDHITNLYQQLLACNSDKYDDLINVLMSHQTSFKPSTVDLPQLFNSQNNNSSFILE